MHRPQKAKSGNEKHSCVKTSDFEATHFVLIGLDVFCSVAHASISLGRCRVRKTCSPRCGRRNSLTRRSRRGVDLCHGTRRRALTGVGVKTEQRLTAKCSRELHFVSDETLWVHGTTHLQMKSTPSNLLLISPQCTANLNALSACNVFKTRSIRNKS